MRDGRALETPDLRETIEVADRALEGAGLSDRLPIDDIRADHRPSDGPGLFRSILRMHPGMERDGTNPYPGPFELPAGGKHTLEVWPTAGSERAGRR